MSDSIRIDISSEREWFLLRMIGAGHIEFSDLDEQDKMIVLNSSIEIEEFVSQEEIEEFRSSERIHHPDENEGLAKNLVRSVQEKTVRLWRG